MGRFGIYKVETDLPRISRLRVSVSVSPSPFGARAVSQVQSLQSLQFLLLLLKVAPSYTSMSMVALDSPCSEMSQLGSHEQIHFQEPRHSYKFPALSFPAHSQKLTISTKHSIIRPSIYHPPSTIHHPSSIIHHRAYFLVLPCLRSSSYSTLASFHHLYRLISHFQSQCISSSLPSSLFPPWPW